MGEEAKRTKTEGLERNKEKIEREKGEKERNDEGERGGRDRRRGSGVNITHIPIGTRCYVIKLTVSLCHSIARGEAQRRGQTPREPTPESADSR